MPAYLVEVCVTPGNDTSYKTRELAFSTPNADYSLILYVKPLPPTENVKCEFEEIWEWAVQNLVRPSISVSKVSREQGAQQSLQPTLKDRADEWTLNAESAEGIGWRGAESGGDFAVAVGRSLRGDKRIPGGNRLFRLRSGLIPGPTGYFPASHAFIPESSGSIPLRPGLILGRFGFLLRHQA